MDDERLGKVSWYLMGAAAVMQVAPDMMPDIETLTQSAIRWLSLIPLCSGIYAQLRSKQYEPFRQWQLYAYPVAAAGALPAAYVVTLIAMWRLSWLRKKGEPVQVREENDGKTDWYIVLGGVAGLVSGVFAAGSVMEGSGDSPGGAVPFFCLIFATSLVGAASGKVAKEAQAFKAGKGSGTRMVLPLIVLVLLCGFWYTVWSGADEGTRRIRSIAAWADLRNCRTNLEAYFDEHKYYPPAFEEAQCKESKDVVLSAITMTKHEYTVVAYHKKGSLEYMVRSGSGDLLFRKKNSPEEWVVK